MSIKVYILRTCKADMISSAEEAKGFRWPESGPVECQDWDPAPRCGGGLHGLLWGEGDGSLLCWDPDAKWLVVEAEASDVVEIDDEKVKFPRGNVVFCGDRKGATDFMQSKAPNGKVIVGAFVTVGDKKTAVVGYRGTATAGRYGTATAGDRGTATAGDRGTATAGRYGTATAGDVGTATAGYGGTATAGRYGTATAGNRGTAVAVAGAYGRIQITFWDGNRHRIKIGYIGEDGLKQNVKYKLNEKNEFEEVK